jgi:hypothetical protein
MLLPHYKTGRDSSVGIATRYGLDCPGIESQWGRDFPHPSRPALGPPPTSCSMGTGSFPGVKRPGRGADHPPPSSAEVKESVELYLYSPPGPSWPVLWLILPLLNYKFARPHCYYLCTAWNTVLIEKLTGSQLVKCPPFYGNQWFTTALTSACHLSLS